MVSAASSITQEYEERVLETFALWYRKAQPTMKEASVQAYIIARDTVKGLTTTQVIQLLQEHEAWTHQIPQESCTSDKGGITIGEIARRHFVHHLEQVIQRKGLQTAYKTVKAEER